MPGSNLSTTLVGAGNAAGLFPEITPAPTPSPGPGGTNPAAERGVSPAGRAVDVVTSAPVAPVLGLIALGVAFLLVMTRLSLRRRKIDAARLFTEIPPSPTPNPVLVGTNPAAEQSVSPAERPADVNTSAPATPVLGLIALVVAFLLLMTRLFVRTRRNRRGPGA